MEENTNNEAQTKKTNPKIVNKPTLCHVCGAPITWFNRARHLRTIKHKQAYYINHEKFEMK